MHVFVYFVMSLFRSLVISFVRYVCRSVSVVFRFVR